MSKEIIGGYDIIKNEKKFTEQEKITQEKFKKIIESQLGDPEKILERWVKNLKNSLENISEKVNNEYKEKCSKMLLNKDGTIRMNAFNKGEGGPYKKEDKSDKKYIEHLEQKWAKEKLNKLKEGKKFDELEIKEKISELEIEKEKNFGELWEKTKTVILDKIIDSEFIVVRASKYDDYKNGVDNVIIDKKSGNVVCAFDEVSTEEGTEKDVKKSEKVDKKNEKGGATIKYGITVNEENKIIKKEIENIPVFYLRLSGGDLVKLLKEMNFKNNKPSKIELEVFDNLVDSLKNQLKELKNKDFPKDENKKEVEVMLANLEEFEYSLEKIEDLRKSFDVDE